MSGNRLEGKVAIITGGASGIGAESVKLFTQHGARVVVVDIQDELGQNVVVSVGEDKASYYHCDVTDEKDVENAVKFTIEKYGKLDILFSNAGGLEPMESILDMNLDHFDRSVAITIRGSAAFIKHAARAMVEKGTRGSIVCTTSIASEIAGKAAASYTASKHGLKGLIKSAAGGLGKYGIRVNGVAPFGVATPAICNGYNLDPSVVEAGVSASANLKGIVLKAHHIAEAALFLASDEAAYISGQNLAVDGGYSVVKE